MSVRISKDIVVLYYFLVGLTFIYNFNRKSSAKALEVLNQVDKDSTNWYLETRRKALESSTSEQVERLSKQWETNDKANK